MKKLLPILSLLIVAASMNEALGGEWTTLTVSGEQVKIYRDEYGVPHIFAETNRGLFQGYGYAIAEDRLWQLELFRRASQGRLAEIFGANVLVTNVGSEPALTAIDADRDIRTRHYTNAELQEQLARLDAEEVEIFAAYADGINRYLDEVVAPDPATRLPYEFYLLQIGVPEPWTTLDVVASGVYQSRFGQVGGQERRNQTLFNNLVKKHGQTTARAIFNDIRWMDDPDTPVSVPVSGAVDRRQHSDTPARPEQLEGASDPPKSMEEDADAVFDAVGVPTTIGSHGWVVSSAKSANGSAMLFGGPQVQFNTPELFHEVQLKGGNGFNVMGRAFAGFPIIFSGRTDHMAWTMTTGTFGDVRDTYNEALCGEGTGYRFNGTCTPFETRVEVIKVKGAASVNLPILRTVHGPVIQGADPLRPGVCKSPCFSQKRVSWKREMESERAFLALNRARNLQEFEAAVRTLEISHNILYADKVGNIAYWLSGKIPVRPVAGFDSRLPLPGTGEAEWTGQFRAVPFSINPTRGWLTSWNSKPEVGYPNPDSRSFGKQYRSLEIDQRLETGLISLADMKNIAEDIARTEAGSDGRDSRYLKPYLLRALDEFPPSNTFGAQARSVLENWDGSLFADAISSTTLEPGQVIFDKWFTLILSRTFGDELGSEAAQASTNMLIHVLDQALGDGSGVPPTRDYFNGAIPNQVMSSVFDEALTALGTDPTNWSTQPRNIVTFRHTLYPAIPEVATMLDSNRGTYAMVIVLSHPQLTSESILSLGASGFIGRDASNPAKPLFDPHFSDQLSLFRNFQYKPMRLYRNTQLHE